MESPTPFSDEKCSWCGTPNSASDNACAKCGAVLSAIQASPVGASSTPEVGTPIHTEQISGPAYQEVDTSLFDKAVGEAMRSLGLAPPFKSGRTRALVVAGFLSLYVLIALVGVFSDLSRVELLSRETAGLAVPRAEVNANDAQTLLVRLAIFSVALFTAVSFLAWIYRAYKNLKALGALDLKYSPGWAIGGFFIPLLNLYRPYQVVREIWNSSEPGASRKAAGMWGRGGTPLFIGLWWGSWLASGFLNSAAGSAAFGASAADELLTSSRFLVANDVISIICALLAMTVVLKIDARQARLNYSASLQGSGEPEIVEHQP